MQSITCALHASAAKQLHAPKAHHEGKEKVNRIMAITGVRMRPFESQSSFRASAVSLYVISPSVSLCVSLSGAPWLLDRPPPLCTASLG